MDELLIKTAVVLPRGERKQLQNINKLHILRDTIHVCMNSTSNRESIMCEQLMCNVPDVAVPYRQKVFISIDFLHYFSAIFFS